ncbi:NUDIX hydrolase [Sedimentibacter sp. MB31-C6]|uniref:NUDIX hydrolase n=1 Tax=Sedimentibacter sp. MB31-C6 TaxID=3109366 RepID=UPI002DDD37F7|nr:NUDIX hydrolase [Sedimentibacter sp. MB36-C1]WSI04908.1 NUDIX hydrolase [Sedimentibacter sp. MB36-C1]
MNVEVSAGGIVFFRNNILMLRKFNGDWVLPKGRVEEKETLKDAAIREVFEESNSKVLVIKYIGKINYEFNRTCFQDNVRIYKEVYWYLMMARSMNCIAQKNEGFIEARFLPFDRTLKIARYDDERKIIKKAVEDIKNHCYK